MTEAARLVDELTTLLYEPCLGKCLTHGPDCRIAVCGACRKKADKPESVVHESDCPVYRLHRAEDANTAVIRANAEEIADLEDTRDELEAKVNALTAQMECRNELTARIRALEAEVARLKLTTRSDREYAEMKQRAEEAERQVAVLREALRLARSALMLAHQQAGRPDPHYMVLDVTRIEIGRIDAALSAAQAGEGEACC